ncbi:unknown [Prevotella sp. CAG:487]|nr:unknown [Prevotella sp. CAG:487]
MHKLLETNKKIYYPSLAWLCCFLFSSLFLCHFVSFRFIGIYIMC